MRSIGFRPALVLAAVLALLPVACKGQPQQPPAAAPGVGAALPSTSAGGLSIPTPSQWQQRPPGSPMRLAEYSVPGPGGDASLVIFRFQGGGSAQANIDRWISQFEGAAQSNGGAGPTIAKQERDGLVLTSLDVSGNYGGTQMPGAPPQPPIENARLLGLVIEGKGDPFFLKLQGPAATVGEWTADWAKIVASARVD